MGKDLSEFLRVDLCHQPTPLEEMPRLTSALGGPKLWIKRDDCTGLATGGNKTRKLEFLVADALDKEQICLSRKGLCNQIMSGKQRRQLVNLDSIVMLCWNGVCRAARQIMRPPAMCCSIRCLGLRWSFDQLVWI